MNYVVRKIRPSEMQVLSDFLYEAIFIPEGAAPPPVVQTDRLTTCGGDNGGNICGGMGPFLGFLPCSTHHKPEVQEDNALNGDYDFYRPTIRVEMDGERKWRKQYERNDA